MGLYLELFWVFVKVGFTSFGGLSMIPVINQEMLAHQWMTAEEVTDIVAIAEMTPGPVGLNCATFVGLRTGGIPGIFCTTLGVLVPSLTLCLAASVFLAKVKGNPVLETVMYGIRPACIGLILYTIYTLSVSNFIVGGTIYWTPVIISALIGFISWKWKPGVPALICMAGILGLFMVK